MPTPEGRVKAKIKELLNAYGVWFYMPVSMGFGVHGVPDFLCLVKGTFFAIEAKAGNAQPTGLQQMQMTRLRGAGAKVFVINAAKINDLEYYLSTELALTKIETS
jgi:hypothetical protein